MHSAFTAVPTWILTGLGRSVALALRLSMTGTSGEFYYFSFVPRHNFAPEPFCRATYDDGGVNVA